MEFQAWATLFGAMYVMQAIPGQNVALVTATTTMGGWRIGLQVIGGVR